MAALLFFLFGLAGWMLGSLGRPEPDRRVFQFTVPLPEAPVFVAGAEPGGAVISPDGLTIAFVAPRAGGPVLWLRPLDSFTPRALAGTEGAFSPFWSPDSRSLGYFTEGRLHKVSVDGTPPQVICDAADGHGGTWSPSGVILFAPGGSGGLYRVSTEGGEPSPVTRLDPSRHEDSHCWPYFLPDGSHFLYLARNSKRSDNGVYLAAVDGASPGSAAPRRLVATNFNAAFAPSPGPGPGRLLFVREGALMAQPFDAARLELTGEARPIAGNLHSIVGRGKGHFSVSGNGVLILRTGGIQLSELQWFGIDGTPLGKAGPADSYFAARLSPDGNRVVAARADPQTGIADLWLTDLARGVTTRITFEDGFDHSPLWSPDGNWIVFASTRDGVTNLFRKAADGSSGETQLTRSAHPQQPLDWSSDGAFLLYEEIGASRKRNLHVLPLAGRPPALASFDSQFNEYQGQFSPDGRWLAYTSDESGRPEIYVRSLADRDAKWQVSTTGASQPKWHPGGRQLFYLAIDGKLMSVPVHPSASTLELEPGRALFDFGATASGSLNHRYDIAADGKRLLALTPVTGPGADSLRVTVNWPFAAPR